MPKITIERIETLERAVEILNKYVHRGFRNWMSTTNYGVMAMCDDNWCTRPTESNSQALIIANGLLVVNAEGE